MYGAGAIERNTGDATVIASGRTAHWVDPPPILAPAGGVGELAMLVREAMAAEASRTVLWLHLSRLPPRLRKAHHRRLMENALSPLRNQHRLRRFDLPNGDVAAIALPPALALDTLRQNLSELFDASDLDYLVSSMKLPEEAAVVMTALEGTLGLLPPVPEEESAEIPLSVEELVKMERALSTADLALFTRQQSICQLTAENGGARLWAKDTRVSLAQILATLAPGREVSGNPGLRRRLRRALDDRLLVEMARADNASSVHPRSIALCLPSLAAEAFIRLDAALPEVARRSACIFIEAGDILAQPSTFRAARQFLEARGYSLGLEISNEAQLGLLIPEELGVTALHLPWLLARRLGQDRHAELFSAGDVIISGADLPSSIAWGWQHGFMLFQGQAVERRARRL